MNKIFTCLFGVIFLSSCLSTPTISPTVEPTDTPQLILTKPPGTLKTGYLKTLLEVVRNGKVYEVVIGYDRGDGWRYEAPKLEYPDWFESAPQAPSTEIHWAGDIDKDGEIEFIVELIYCGASCASLIQVYDYDSALDNYRVFDEIYGALGEEYKDIDKDGSPEIISANTSVFSAISSGTAFAPILIYKYRNSEFSVVTKEYPTLIEEEANHWLEATKTDGWEQGAGYVALASYLYNMYLLGKEEEGNKVFKEICSTHVDAQISNPDWSCDEYFLDIQKRILDAQSAE